MTRGARPALGCEIRLRVWIYTEPSNSLAHGVPLVCMPMGRDQHDNAARVAACGAGTVLAAGAGVSEVRHAVQAVLGAPQYRDAARRMPAVIARQNGRETALNELEMLLGAT